MALGNAGLERIQEAVETLDPDGRYVTLDVAAQSVSYSSEIQQWEAIGNYTGEEEPCRAFIVAWLCTTGGYLPANIELEKRYSIGRPKVGAEVDILVNQPDGTPFMLLECKSPDDFPIDLDKYIEGQLFGIAPQEHGCTVLGYATVVAGTDGVVEAEAIVIAYAAGDTFAQWKVSRRSSAEIPANYGRPVHEHYTKNGPRSLRTAVSGTELDRLRKRLHNVLWGGARDDNLIYAYVVKLFLARIHDEQTVSDGERYRFQIYYIGDIRENPAATFERINDLYLEAANRFLAGSDDENPDPLNPREFSHEQIAWVVELLQGISLTDAGANGDLMGRFFEGITRDGFKQTKGLFFTHFNLAVFMVEALDLGNLAERKLRSGAHTTERLPYIIDPSCGSGTFLLAAMNAVTDHVTGRRSQIGRNDDLRNELRDKFPEDAPNRWAREFIYGVEIREDLAIASKVNMVLHHDGHTHIFQADGLGPLARYSDARMVEVPGPEDDVYAKPRNERFDVVVTNPPFSLTLDRVTAAASEHSFELAGSSNSETLFLERWYQLLRPGGRLAAVLPESFFSTAENLTSRLFVYDHFDIRAVVSLPPHAFEPWTPTRTSLLFAQKKERSSEARWIERRLDAEAAAKRALRLAGSRIRSLTAERKRPLSEEKRAELAEELRVACESLGLEDVDVSDLEGILLVLKGIDPVVRGFNAALDEHETPHFLAVTTDQIGYKRTRRAEYPRDNDLFVAVSVSSGDRVLNLNDGAGEWTIEIAEDSEDVLSMLREADLWA